MISLKTTFCLGSLTSLRHIRPEFGLSRLDGGPAVVTRWLVKWESLVSRKAVPSAHIPSLFFEIGNIQHLD
jgi:hypothetical protein